MKSSSRIIAGLVGVSMMFQVQGCYGNFALTRKLYDWNGQIGDKWINSLGALVLLVLQVYTVAGIVDYVVLNTLQFWTGQNPVVMNEGEKDIQIVHREGKTFQITATKNRMEVREIVAGKTQEPVSLVFNEATKVWSAESGTQIQPMIEVVEGPGQIANVIHPDGHKERVQLVDN